MKEELLKGFTEEQIAKIKACKNQEELLTLAKEEGVELTEEQLEAVSGGCNTSNKISCPDCFCASEVVTHWDERYYRCNRCGHTWLKPEYDY